MDERRKAALALAALEAGVWVEYNQTQNSWYFDIPHSMMTAWGETPMDALAHAAEALNLTPSPLMGLTEEERQIVVAALEVFAPKVHLEAVSKHRDAETRAKVTTYLGSVQALYDRLQQRGG